MKYIKGLDTLRAFAIIFVIIEHWSFPINAVVHDRLAYWGKGLFPDGGFGVDLFFVLSGYLITSILLNAREEHHGQNKFKIIKNFIIRRTLRIFPIYYITILLLVIVGYPFLKDSISWFLLYMGNMLTFKNHAWNSFSHTWSLAVEEQFYLVWPWFIVFVRKEYLKYVFIAAIITGIATSFYTMSIRDNWAGFVLMPSCMPAFGIGGLYAYVRVGSRRSMLLFLKFMSAAFPIALFLHFYATLSDDRGDIYYFFLLTINSILSVWLIHKVIQNKSMFVKKYILENRVLNKIGQISYGVYLFHFILWFFYEGIVRKLFSDNVPREEFWLDWKHSYFIRLFLLISISLISFYGIEKPVLKLKDRFKY